MKPFYFSNPGILPMEAITILGISSKDSENAIGRFGTGLKYTIAGVLRMGEEISIETAGRTYYFTKVPTTVKGKEFHVVHMQELRNGEAPIDRELGFTTDLGKHWEPWMYVRELWSNMKDEGGEHGWLALEMPKAVPADSTRIIVGGHRMSQAYANLDSFILNSKPIKVLGGVEFHYQQDPFDQAIFYQGIRVGKFEKPYPYTLNITRHMDLTEDRTIQSPWYAIGCASAAILGSTDEDMITEFLCARDDTMAGDFGVHTEHMEDYAKAVLERLWNESPFKLSRSAQRVAHSAFKPDDTNTTFTLSEVEKEKFSRALAMLQKLGFDHDIDWQFVDPKDENSFGFCRSGKVYLCKSAFNNGTQFLCQVMMEEYIHHVKDLDDYTPALQNLLFAKVISLAEELHGTL